MILGEWFYQDSLNDNSGQHIPIATGPLLERKLCMFYLRIMEVIMLFEFYSKWLFSG